MTKTTETTTTTKATAATPGTQDAPQSATTAKVAKTSKNAPNAKGARKTATVKSAKPATKTAAKKNKPAAKKATGTGSIPREYSKKAIVLDLLRRKEGATMAAIAKATGWQNHSIRGFVSGTLTKKMGLAVESSKNEAGERVYRITGK
jgi:hypothetical protein